MLIASVGSEGTFWGNAVSSVAESVMLAQALPRSPAALKSQAEILTQILDPFDAKLRAV